MPDRIKKDRFEPAYAQLAAILRRQIAGGVYPPGEKIPSEPSISKQYGISIMTVRQAIGLLTEQGLIERVRGSGTFVKPVTLTESRFDLDSIKEIFEDPERTRVKVLQISLARADAKTANMLSLPEGDRIILIRRLLLRDNHPAMSHVGRIRCDPTRPVVEAELSVGPLSDLFNGHGGGTAKKGELSVIPTVLSEEEAALLSRPVGTPVFRLEYVVYDFHDTPFGWGWFTAAPETLTLKTKLGSWDES
ncbi:MAG: GntR family transcriptional regulator [Desulfomonilaceae bacterium]